ncbi:hypothetical protein DY000_02053643 [Brassica cretica]|uniref:Uncharacterized protein n=1 Tax=Brassica cretica TaxID=69181 RepID=A0ABQ7ADJ7_BRACR|nr:hypothetical protein DY000_02053643 [Brassica cretica]
MDKSGSNPWSQSEFLRFLNRKVQTLTPIKMKQERVRSNPEGGELRVWDEGRLVDPTRRRVSWLVHPVQLAPSGSYTMGVLLSGIRCLRP